MTSPRIRTLLVDDEPLARAHLRDLLEPRDDIAIVGECGDGLSAVQRIGAGGIDLVLLDVQMPELDGLDVVRRVGADRMPATVFVTAYDEHALAAFEVHAIDYVLKPVNRSRLQRAIDHAVRLAERQPQLAAAVEEVREAKAGSGRLAVRVGEKMVYLRIADFDWIEAADDHIRIHAGKQIFTHRMPLSQIERVLPAEKFVRIHRSTIVNIDRIREFEPWFQGDWIVVLEDGTRVQSGRSYRAVVRALLDA